MTKSIAGSLIYMNSCINVATLHTIYILNGQIIIYDLSVKNVNSVYRLMNAVY